MRSRPSPQVLVLALLVLANLVWRFSFWPMSRGSYTDGILQVDMFRLGLSFWPPLFALLTRLVAWVPGVGLENGGRFIATLCGALALLPLAGLARRLFGWRAALWSALAWTASPMALRWSLQPMTDTPLVLFWLLALLGLVLAFEAALPGLFAQNEPAPVANFQKCGQWLMLAAIAAVLASLTRFQGLLLAPALGLAALYLTRVRRLTAPGMKGLHPLLSLLPWLAFPAWLLRQGLGPLANHFSQIGDRAGAGGSSALLNYVLLFEEFAKQAPFFMGYGVFLFAVFGLLRVNWAPVRLRAAGWVALYFVIAVLALQSVFSSFQERYLLPLLPLVCLFAGHGFAVLERHTRERRRRFWYLAGPALVFGVVFSGLVAAQQGDPFYDLKQAARTMGEHPPKGRLLTNEAYGKMQLVGPKTRYWSGLPAEKIAPVQTTTPAAGDVILLSSYDCASRENYHEILKTLVQRAPAKIVQRFARRAVPIFPDIMENGSLAQNPLALTFRYQPQYFETVLLEVLPRPGSEPIPEESRPPLNPASSPQMEQLQQELQGLGQQMQELQKK